MKNLIRLTDYKAKDVYEIFDIADEIIQGKYKDILNGKTVVFVLSKQQYPYQSYL